MAAALLLSAPAPSAAQRTPEPPVTDSAAVFALAVDRVLAADTTGRGAVRLGAVPRAAWATAVLVRLRQVERPGAAPMELSLGQLRFAGDTASVIESRLSPCGRSAIGGGDVIEHRFVRTAGEWRIAPSGFHMEVDRVCAGRPAG